MYIYDRFEFLGGQSAGLRMSPSSCTFEPLHEISFLTWLDVAHFCRF